MQTRPTYTSQHSLRCTGTAILACLSMGYGQLTWQTTHTTNGGYNQGQSIVVRNQAKVTVFPNYLDVEEDLEIATQGTVNAGNDASSLEIVATLSLSPEAAIVGGLLWNGETILGAKLLSRVKADSLYEEQVDRNSVPPPRPRDPLILEKTGAGTYRARIYPVALGSTRRIRIRYHIPPVATAKGIYLPLRTLLATSTPQVTVHLTGTDRATQAIVIQGNTARTIAFPRSLILTSSDFSIREPATPTEHGYASLLIQPGDSPGQLSSFTQFTKGGMAGHYFNLHAVVPEVVVNVAKLSQMGTTNFNPVVTATVRNSEHAYDLNVACMGSNLTCYPVVFHGKSTKPWDSTITWTVFNKQGEVVETVQQQPKAFLKPNDTTTAVLWASSISPFSESRENPLGPVYGFVDGWASLLALEKDAMDAKAQAALAAGGVPRISNDFFQDVLPNYNTQTPTPNGPFQGVYAKHRADQLRSSEHLFWKRASPSQLEIKLPGYSSSSKLEKVEILSLDGQSQSLGSIQLNGNGLLTLELKGLKAGMYWLRIKWQGRVLSTRILW